MNDSLPTVTVVIPTNGGRAEIIGRTIPVLLADAATSELIVAFDSEDPVTRELVESYTRSDERVKSIRTGDNAPGHTRGQWAREAAIPFAHGEIVLALDDDVEAEPGLVSGHARRHAGSDADSMVVGYMPVSPQRGSRVAAPVRLYAEEYERACFRFSADERNVLTGLWAGNISLPRRCWPDPRGAALELDYHDDREFGLRLRRLGVRGVFDPGLRAAHRYQRSRSELLRDAQSSGRAEALLHSTYPDLVPAPVSSRNGLARSLVRLSRSRLGWMLTTQAVLAASRAFAMLGLKSADYNATRLLWRLGVARGVREAS